MVQVQVYFWPVDAGAAIYELCPGENLTINGSLYDEQNPAGVETYFYANGCDSFYLYVQLLYRPEYYDTVHATIESGGTYVVGDSVFAQTGTYSIDLKTVNGCDSTIILVLNVALESDEADLYGPSFRIFPNPANDLAHIETTGVGQLQAVQVFDLAGRLVHVPEMRYASWIRLNTGGLPPGLYTVGVQMNGRWRFAKLVRMHSR